MFLRLKLTTNIWDRTTTTCSSVASLLPAQDLNPNKGWSTTLQIYGTCSRARPLSLCVSTCLYLRTDTCCLSSREALLSESSVPEAASEVLSLSGLVKFMNVSSKLSSFGQTHYTVRTRTRKDSTWNTLGSGLTASWKLDRISRFCFSHPPFPGHSSGCLLKLSAGSADPSGYSTHPVNLNVQNNIKSRKKSADVSCSTSQLKE